MKRKSQVRVGLLGLGSVGTGVAEILKRHRRLIAERLGSELVIVRALVRDAKKPRSGAAGAIAIVDDPRSIVAAPDIDIVVELAGGLKPASSWIAAALRAGQRVVTANKAVLAREGETLAQLADEHRTGLYFEAAVAGGVPIIRTLREGLAGDRITSVAGILNGTCNFLLEKMEAGVEYETALREAQALGFAEADPTLDVSGRDAADKIAILARLAFGATIEPRQVSTEGITGLDVGVLRDAAQLGYRVKLLGIARRMGRGAIELRVHPTMVPQGTVLSAVPGAQNAIAVTSDALGTTVYQGPGAGGLATGSAVVADIIEAARDLRGGARPPLVVTSARGASQVVDSGAAVSSYYLRLIARDRSGVLAAVAEALARHQVSLATVLQRDGQGSGVADVPVVLVTHPAPWRAMREAVGDVGKLAAIRGRVRLVRIESELA